MLRYLILLAKGGELPPFAARPFAPSRLHAGLHVWTEPQGTLPWTLKDCGDALRIGLDPAAAPAVTGWDGPTVRVTRERNGGFDVRRDPSGGVPAVWADLGAYVAVASDVELLIDQAGETFDLDWGYLPLVAAGHYLPARRTGFAGVQELIPGEALHVGPHGVSSRLAWSPAASVADRFGSVAEARRALRTSAEASAAFWSGVCRNVVLDLSGGLDSSSVLGLLASASRPPRITGLHLRAGHAEGDEIAFAAGAAALHGATLVERPLEIATLRFGYVAGLPARPTARLLGLGADGVGLEVARRENADAYVTGRGGDHLFYAHTPTLSALDRLKLTRNPIGWIREAYSAARRSGRPIGAVLVEAWRPPDPRAAAREFTQLSNWFVAGPILEDGEVAEHLHPWLTEALEAGPPGKVAQVAHLVELQQHYDRNGRAAEIDEVHPFIATPLIEAALRTPSWMFSPGAVDRGLQREIFRDLLPPAVVERREKGATTSHSLRTYRRNLDLIREVLLDGALAKRGLIDRAAVEGKLTPAGCLDGRFSWHLRGCLATELWIAAAQAYRPRSAAAPPRSAAS